MFVGVSHTGGVAERSNAAVLKTAEVARLPWVRIPPPPPSTPSADASQYRRALQGRTLGVGTCRAKGRFFVWMAIDVAMMLAAANQFLRDGDPLLAAAGVKPGSIRISVPYALYAVACHALSSRLACRSAFQSVPLRTISSALDLIAFARCRRSAKKRRPTSGSTVRQVSYGSVRSCASTPS